MQNSLWKLGALLGVIGIGFLVLWKAQNEMADRTSPTESFDELTAIEELSDLKESSKSSADDSLAETYADTYSAAPPSSLTESVEDAGPEPTPAAEMTSPAGADSEPADSANPFAAFASTPAAEEDTVEPTLADDTRSPALDDEMTNPFGALVESFTEDASSETPEQDAESERAPVSTLADVDSPTTQPTGDPSSELEAGADAAGDVADMEPSFAAAPDGVDTDAENLDPFAATTHTESADDEPTMAAALAEDTDEQDPASNPFEPTSLTALPPADGGPALMSPPDESDDSTPPASNEPALAEIDATETAEPVESAAGSEIAQVTAEQPHPGEQRSRSASAPNPPLVFPGSDEPAQSEPPRDEPAATPAFPGADPQPAGRAWVGDTPGNRQPAVAPDGTYEMTIMPRNGEPQTTSMAEDGLADINPFATAPAAATSRHEPAASPLRQASEPARLEAPPARSATAAQPQFPDPGLSFSKGPIQPSAAEIPDSEGSTGGLTSADFVGVGTISPDTPSTPQQAQLTIEKQAPSDAALGQELIYSILVKNIGRSQAKNVVVEDLVPRGTQLQGTDPQAQMTPDKKLVWQLGTMSPGASRTIRIKVIPTEAGQIGSVATVSFEAAVASRTVVTAPQLQLALNGPQEVRVGEKAPYKFTLTNAGSADASNVYIRNIIPAGFEHPAAQQHNGVTDLEYEVGTLRRGESREVELTLLAVEEGRFQNHAILTADGNVNVETQQPVNVITSRLKIQREGPAHRVVGSQATFTNTVTNQSSRPLQGVTITETIPAGIKFVEASEGGYYNAQQRRVIWQLSALEPGGVRRLQTIVLAEQSGQMSSTVSAVDQQGDQSEATSQLKVAGYSSLTVDVTNPARAIPVGEEVALRLKVRNGGTAAANGVETRIQLPPELKFVSARGPVRYAQQGEWIAFEPIDRIDIEGEQTFDIVLAATSESQDARVVVQLTSDELSRPLSEDESVVIYADGP